MIRPLARVKSISTEDVQRPECVTVLTNCRYFYGMNTNVVTMVIHFSLPEAAFFTNFATSMGLLETQS